MVPLLRIVALVLLTASPAVAQPLWDAELRLGYGIQTSSDAGMLGARTSPVTIHATAAVATQVDPPLSVVGGLLIEALDRTSFGATAGLRLSPGDTLRFGVGGAVILAPYQLYGATASAGACSRLGPRFAVCGDLQLTAYLAGSDLAEGHGVTQVQLVGGIHFDAP